MQGNPFDTRSMAQGYARWRPPVHPLIVDRIRTRLGRVFDQAVDIGCGAGLSTAALEPIAARRTGIEPSHAMLLAGRNSGASFAVGRAEAIPVRTVGCDLMTAAGSLNWADLDLFFPEARRVLRQGGMLVVYDFGQGKQMSDGGGLDEWESEFKLRYPSPPCREISIETLDFPGHGFAVEAYEEFRIGLPLSESFYLEYAMTETNVHHAVARGVPEPEIRDWCARTLQGVFDGGTREVIFEGFIAYAQR